jgi:hypothetical protein
MSSGYGLNVRWSLHDAGDVDQALRDYVIGTSMARFAREEGLSFKTWGMRSGEWFEAHYVWASRQERDAFARRFTQQAPKAVVTEIVGSPPTAIEPFEVVAVTEGVAGFSRGAGPGEG